MRTFGEHELGYEELEVLSEAELAGLFPCEDAKNPARYEQLASYFPTFAVELRKTGCTLLALWRRYLADHPGGYRYTQFTHHFNKWKGRTNPSGILRHRAGRKLFIDFAGKTLPYVDCQTGEVLEAQVFVGILPCSQYTYAAAVARGHKYAPAINKTIKGLALHYGCAVDPTRPYHPKDKALVEGAARLVYQRIYYSLSTHTFFSLAELNGAIGELLGPYNEVRFHNRPTTRRQTSSSAARPGPAKAGSDRPLVGKAAWRALKPVFCDRAVF